MSEEQSQTRRVVTVTEEAREPEPISFAEFLETVPPSQLRHISPLVEGKSDQVLTPELQLHCTESFCNGVRFFRHDESDYELLMSSEFIYFYMRYLCSNCQRGSKIFAIAAKKDEGKSTTGQARKLGEMPPYGPPTSSRLISLIGPDRELFLSGRRCETQGLGVGTFAYYRRVVENQKGRIIQSIIKVAERSSASSDVIYKLKK